MSVDPIESADRIVSYFQRLVDGEGAAWERQLLVAQLWRSILRSGAPVYRDEFLRMAAEFAETDDLGTAYDELIHLITGWAESSN